MRSQSRVINEVTVPRIQAGERDEAITAAIGSLTGVIASNPRRLRLRHSPPPQSPPVSGLRAIFYGTIAVLILGLLITHPSLALYFLTSILSSGRGGGGGGFGWGNGDGFGWGGGGFRGEGDGPAAGELVGHGNSGQGYGRFRRRKVGPPVKSAFHCHRRSGVMLGRPPRPYSSDWASPRPRIVTPSVLCGTGPLQVRRIGRPGHTRESGPGILVSNRPHRCREISGRAISQAALLREST
jgi:hypothetical protein